MPRKRTPEEIRMWKERRVFDLGTTYIQITGAERNLRRARNWDEDEA